MIYYDVTKMGAAAHRSGLTRLSRRLLDELGDNVRPVVWRREALVSAGANGATIKLNASDWLFTVELFSEAERPGWREFLVRRPCRLAAMFADAIPVRLPHITWPQSVQRHPEYMKLLAGFDVVFAISQVSLEDLAGFWRWQGVAVRARTTAVELGADFDGSARRVQPDADDLRRTTPGRPLLLAVGIVEPRKNQMLLLDVAEALWTAEVDFDLSVAGRVNPHFGRPIAARMRALQRREPRFRYHEAADDRTLAKLYGTARVVAFPTIAEGCGLPVLEALWRGVPCVCSDLPVLREITAGGGCSLAGTGDAADWQAKLREVLIDDVRHAGLRREARERGLPRWRDTAAAVLAGLR